MKEEEETDRSNVLWTVSYEVERERDLDRHSSVLF